MKKILILLAMALPLSLSAQNLGIVPAPREATVQKGSFRLKGAGINYPSSLENRTVKAIIALADDISGCTGKTSSVATTNGISAATPVSALKGIYFVEDAAVQAENYTIEITPRTVKVSASDHNGFYYAIQSLRQMMPVGNYAARSGKDKWVLPCCLISDGPRFGYRGMMLDACRHFWSVDEVKKYLDIMAIYKLNRFHWHLTEDQGWRMEISKYPLLTQVGAFRDGTMVGHDFDNIDGVRYGGYYTREQMKDIVEYAWERGITVVPEIDLPGHMVAALTAYPHLGCTGGPYSVWTRWGISKDVLCVGKESTFEFLQDVLDEMCEIFPSEYIHIGGDECPKDRWKECPDCQARIKALGLVSDSQGTAEQKLQNYVTKRIQDHLAAKGRKVIGWDEILEGDLQPGATVMSWRGAKGGIKAANRGFDVIMTPNSHLYFDYQQGDPANEPLGPRWVLKAYAGGEDYSAKKVYSFDPFDKIEPAMQGHILGVQANEWTEYIPSEEHLEYMLLPRLLALSEVQWCSPENRDYSRFVQEVKEHQEKIFELLGYNYRKM